MKICKDKKGSDKKLHMFCEFAIAAAVGGLISPFQFPSALIAAVIAFAVALTFGIWKECRDSKQKGNHFCVWDLAWDVVGCVAGAVLAFLANYYTWHDIAGQLLE
jgi:uncharacterized protein YfiM (DUF2279 family)